jgi:outer membrane usher protein
MVKFETTKGRAAIIDLELPKGVGIPFGSEVSTSAGNSVDIVGQGGRVLARGLDDRGTLVIKWGESSTQQCQVAYVLAPQVQGVKQTFERFAAPCTLFAERSPVVVVH